MANRGIQPAAEDIARGEEGAEWTGKPWMGKWKSIPEKDQNLEAYQEALGKIHFLSISTNQLTRAELRCSIQFVTIRHFNCNIIIGVNMRHANMDNNTPVCLHTFRKGDEYHHKIVVKEAGYVNDVWANVNIIMSFLIGGNWVTLKK